MKLLDSFYEGKKFLVSLRLGISTIFVSIFVLFIIAILLFASIRLSSIFQYLSDRLMAVTSTAVHQQLSALLNTTEPVSRLSKLMIIDQTVNTNNFDEVIHFAGDVLKILPEAQTVRWGDQQGNYVVARRLADNTIMIDVLDRRVPHPQRLLLYHDANGKIIKRLLIEKFDYDPRQHPWYQVAKTATLPSWTNAYKLAKGGGLSLSYVAPLYHHNHFYGVFSIDLNLNSISKFLEKHQVSKNGAIFIIDKYGNIIATSNLSMIINKNVISSNNKLLNINSSPNNPLSKAFEYFNRTKETKFILGYHNNRYFVTFTEIPQLARYNWQTVVIVLENDFIGQITQYRILWIAILLAILLVSLYFITIFSKRISVPIQKLANELEKIKFLHIDASPKINTHIREVFTMANAIESMKLGLHSFKKYVPEDLVRQLIYKGEAAKIGGTNHNLAIFFSDINNFTTISEQISTDKLMKSLCDYFDAMTNIITSHHGTVDKFIGDAIMAFWGAPLADENSVENACFAAVQCQISLAKFDIDHPGDSAFTTRIGIHFGNVIVGNIGSSKRINYTAVGDTVNLASRLEQLNKNYGTKILVSEQVKILVAEKFVFRIIDQITVKGKTQSMYIYELIQIKTMMSDELIAFCENYYNGFIAYQQQYWDQAISYFNLVLSQFPNDVASKIMKSRCEKFKIDPPAQHWNGVWVWGHPAETL